MNRSASRPTRLMLEGRAKALKQHLPKAIEGDGIGVHHARVASRRLREIVPVLAEDVKGQQAAKGREEVSAELTRALGGGPRARRDADRARRAGRAPTRSPANALEDVRAHVVAEREERRETMLKRMDKVKFAKLDCRLASVAEALDQTDSEGWRKALGERLAKRGKALVVAIADAGQMYNPERLHQVRIGEQEAALRTRDRRRERHPLRGPAGPAAEEGAGHARPVARLQVLEEHVAAVQTKPPTRQVPEGGSRRLPGCSKTSAGICTGATWRSRRP